MIIIPTYNEKGNVRQLLEKIRRIWPDETVVFVDDSSPDGTGAEIKKIQASDPQVHLISRPGKAGYASAHLAGIAYALERGAETIYTMDADLSHDPEVLALLANALGQADFSIGSRYVRGGHTVNWAWWRRILSRLANWYARLSTGAPIRDLTSGFMGYRAGFLRGLDLTAIKSQGYAYLMEIKILSLQRGGRASEVPIAFTERTRGRSKLSRSIVREGVSYPLRIFWRRWLSWEWRLWLGLIVFAGSLAVYLLTLPHTIYLGDSAEYIASAATLGIPHPPGNPGYVLLAHLFTWLPFSTLPWRVGVLSAASASVGLLLFYRILASLIRRLGTRLSAGWIYGFAAASALVLGFSPIFWSQALMAKPYALAFAVSMAILALLLKFIADDRDGFVLAALLLAGAGATVHEMILLIAPINILWVYLWVNGRRAGNFWRQKIPPRFVLASLGLFLLGFSVNAFLPIREIMRPAYDASRIFHISDPATWRGFYHYLTRADYADLAKAWVWDDKIKFLSDFFAQTGLQFDWLWLLALPGVIWLYRRGKPYLILTLLFLLANTALMIGLRTIEFGPENAMFQSYYYLVGYSMAGLWLGLGAFQIFELMVHRRLRATALIFAVLFALAPIASAHDHWQANDQAHFTFLDDYSRKLLQSLPPNAVLLSSNDGAADDSIIFSLHYQQAVRHLRPDVTVLVQYDIHSEVPYPAVAWAYGLANITNARYYLVKLMAKKPQFACRPLWATFQPDGLAAQGGAPDPSWNSCSNGLAYQVNFGSADACSLAQIQLDESKDQPVLTNNLFGTDLLAQYHYAQGANLLEAGQFAQSQQELIRAINYDDQIAGPDFQAYQAHRQRTLTR